MIEDAELLRRYALEKSETAFAELVRRHIDFVYACALRRVGGDAHLAADVTQQVFIGLARAAAKLAGREVLSGWLYTTAKYAAAQVVRGERRRQAREQEAHVMNELNSASAHDAEWARLRPVLDDALDGLSDDDRQAVLLRFFEGKSFGDVGARLRVTENTARMRVGRALDKLHAALAQRGVTSTAAALGLALSSQPVVAAPSGLAAAVTGAALAGAAGAGGGALVGLKIIHFMSTTKIVSGVAGVVALLAVGTAVFQTHRASVSTGAATALAAERDELRTRLGAAEKRAQQVDGRLTEAQKEIGDLQAAAAKPAVPPAPPAPSQGAAMDYVLDHPETHAAFVRQQELRIGARYDRFFRSAGLAAEQKESVLRTLTGMLSDELDFMGALRAQGLGVGNMPRDPEERARLEGMIREKKQAAQARLRELLGDELFRKFAQYSGTIPERNVAEQLAGRLSDAEEPLSAAQVNQLAQVLAQNRFAPSPTPAPNATMAGTFVSPQDLGRGVAQFMQQHGMNMLDWTAPVTDAAIAKAQGVLTAPQLAALRHLQAQQLAQIQLAPPPPAGPAAGRK